MIQATQTTTTPAAPAPSPDDALTFAALHDAYNVAVAASRPASKALAKAEESEFAFTRPVAPAPAAIVLVLPAKTFTYDGVTHDLPESAYTFQNRESILAHHKGDAAAAEEMLTALAQWERDQEALDEASGYAVVGAALDEARDRKIEACDAMWQARQALLRYPTAPPPKSPSSTP